ncbi:hypothetical protein [Parvibaculum sp.]|uniref:hypothetical protein n=1 Tax=Parvibaculum sp. TaxID=2024848 RepID=UPI00391DEDE5
MFAASVPVEKTFEIWPGRLSFAAGGAGARDALDAATDMARSLARAVIEDAELLAQGGDVLPRGVAGRHALEAVVPFRDVQGGDLPPPLAALPGAICDTVLDAMRRAAGEADFIIVALGNAAALHMEPGIALPPDADMPPVLAEFARALGPGIQGGVALGGIHSAMPTCGALDMVAVQSKSAAIAGFAAALAADAAATGFTPPKGDMPRDRLLAAGWAGRAIARAPGLVEPEAIWDALSASVRQASALRDRRLLSAAALGFRGRGRTIGPIDGDRLLRFGVSEWR